MTIIAGLVRDGKVYMGADRGMSDDKFIGSMLQPKVKKVGNMLIGYAASLGAGQMAHYLDFPTPQDNDMAKYVRTVVSKVLMEAYQEFGIDFTEDDKAAADFLIGINGHLFELNTNDWSVAEYDLIATGSGSPYAMGSLFSTRDWDNSKNRIREAVKAAIKYSPSCQSPIDVLSV